MFIEHNQNPYGANIDDCVIRAISFALDASYQDVFDGLCELADKLGKDIDQYCVFKKFLDNHGYECREVITKNITVKQLSKYCKGHTVIVLVNGHLTCIKDGNVYDTWNPSRYKVQLLWEVN